MGLNILTPKPILIMVGKKGQIAWNKGKSIYNFQYKNRKEYNDNWRKVNPEKYREQRKRQYLKQTKKRKQNPSLFRESESRFYYRHRKEILLVETKRLIDIRSKLYKILGNAKCVYCGFQIWQSLQFDHINGGGCEDRRKFQSNRQMYKFYINNPDLARKELQVTCANCNFIKRHKQREENHLR